VPREIRYDEEGFLCRMILQESHSRQWDELEAYGDAPTVFLLKFEGRQAIQISSVAFRRDDWSQFKEFLSRTFPDKRCRRWAGPIPLMPKR
jgi:hypothetical protein